MVNRRFPAGIFELLWNRSSLSWTRLLAVIFVLLLSVAIPFTTTLRQLQLVFALMIAAAGALTLLRWPQLGFFLITAGGMVLPTVGPNGLNVPMVAVAMLFGLWLLDYAVNKGEISGTQPRMLVPLLAFIAVSVLAFIAGRLHWYGFAQNAPLDAQLGGFSLYVLAATAFFLAANQMGELAWLRRLVWAFLAVGGLYIFGRVVPGLDQVTRYIFQSQAIGGIFWACLPALALSQALSNRDLKAGWRVLLVALVVATIYVVYVQNYQWKSGWIPALTGVAVVIWLRNPRAGLLLSLAGLLLGARLLPELLASDAYSLSTRFDAWRVLSEVVRANPILGLGFGNYYWYTPLFGIRGYEVSFNSHNNYVDIVAQTGLVGLICLSWFFVEIGRLGWRLRSRVPAGFPLAYVHGVMGALAATLVAAMLGDWMLPFVYNVGLAGFRTGVLIWFFLGGLVFLVNLYPADKASTA